MSRRTSLTSHLPAVALKSLFGTEPRTRVSAAEVSKALYSRTVHADHKEAREAAFALMQEFEAIGLVEDAPGDRGGVGWSLTAKGAGLIGR